MIIRRGLWFHIMMRLKKLISELSEERFDIEIQEKNLKKITAIYSRNI